MLAFVAAPFVACVLSWTPTPAPDYYPPSMIEVHEAAQEAELAEAIHARFHCLEDLNGPYIAPAESVSKPRNGTARTPTPAGSDVIDWSGYVAPYDWNDATALRVIWCESRNDRLAVNPSSGASGGWQFMPFWHSQVDPFDPADATRFAYVLWLDGGGSFSGHWYPSQHCWG